MGAQPTSLEEVGVSPLTQDLGEEVGGKAAGTASMGRLTHLKSVF